MPSSEQHDDFNAGYRGIDEGDILDREGLSPQQYLEFTERLRDPQPNVRVARFLNMFPNKVFLLPGSRRRCIRSH